MKRNKFWYIVLVILFVFSLVACGEEESFTSSKSFDEDASFELSEDVDDAVSAMETADAAMVDEEEYMLEEDNESKNEEIDIDFDKLEDIREIYKPINDCAPSRLKVGDTVYISYGGSPNGIRSEPDVHPSDNILDRAMQGEQLRVIGGPACSWGWILWEVKTTSGLVGWTPESDGDEFWLIPITEPRELPSKIRSDPVLYKVYKEVEDVMSDKSLSNSEKQNQLRIKQNKFGEEVVTYIIRYVPVYNTDRGDFESFDSVMRGFVSDYGDPSSGAPIESDPVGAGMRIFLDPSTETITDMLGLSELGGGEAPSSKKTGYEPTREPTKEPPKPPTAIPTKIPTKKPTNVPVQAPTYWQVYFQNDCNYTIWTAIHYLNLDGNWVTNGFWELSPGSSSLVAKTNNRNFYLYGTNKERTHTWTGDQGYFNVRGQEVGPFLAFNMGGTITEKHTVAFCGK